jgi:hypothetical protein
VRSIKEECLSRMIRFGVASLRRALREYVAHYHAERNHQGVGNRLLEPLARVGSSNDPILLPRTPWRYAQFLPS